MLNTFFQRAYGRLIESPRGEHWWHSMPLPDGNRISGAHKDLQLRMWDALLIPSSGGLQGKRVLDIGANDGFFSLAALAAGASSVTSIDKDWDTWPRTLAMHRKSDKRRWISRLRLLNETQRAQHAP